MISPGDKVLAERSPALCLFLIPLAGRITSLISRGDKVLAERIEEALTKGQALDGLSSDRQVLPEHMRWVERVVGVA